MKLHGENLPGTMITGRKKTAYRRETAAINKSIGQK